MIVRAGPQGLFLYPKTEKVEEKNMTLYQILSLCGIPSLIGAIFVSAVNYVKLKNSSYKLIKELLQFCITRYTRWENST